MNPDLAALTHAVNHNLGPNVQRIMRERRITQRQLAAEMGMTGGSVWDRINGRHRWLPGEVLWLPGYLKVPMSLLLEAPK